MDAMPGYDPKVIRRRPTDIRTVYGESTGGIAHQPAILNRPERQNFNEMNREGTSAGNDTLIKRIRMYVYRNANAIPAGLGAGNLNWTAAGPAKSMPTTRFNRNVRPLVGGGHRDMWGQHTDIISGAQSGNQLLGRSRMVPARVNRLTVQKYRGQSYSQTTQIVGSQA